MQRRCGQFVAAIFLTVWCAMAAYAGRTFVIVSAAPPVREHVPPPMGYISCYTAPPSFYHGVWINAHRICEYDNTTDGRVWVSGYWQCARYRPMEGVCLGWSWMPGHWASPYIAEYGVYWGMGYYGHHHPPRGYYSHYHHAEYEGYQSSDYHHWY